MKKFNYRKIIGQNIKPTKQQYMLMLQKAYKSEYKIINIKNKFKNEFIIFLKAIMPLVHEYNETSNKCLKLRSKNKKIYLNKFTISEINSSLNIENISSSKRIVKEILKIKNQENYKKNKRKLTKNEIHQLISNMDKAFKYIMTEDTINHTTISTLYSIMISNIELLHYNLIGNYYRHDSVKIGKDKGMYHEKIYNTMDDLIIFINSDNFDQYPIIKALIVHYIFEYIHPYFDFNGRMGRMIHLWVLKIISFDDFWKNTYLSESIFAYRNKFYKAFKEMNEAKEYNFDLTLWISHMLEIFIMHNKSYIQMKEIIKYSRININAKTRLFIMDIIIQNNINPDMWFNRKHFDKVYPDYTKTIGDRVMQELKKSGLFDIRQGRPKEYRLKEKYRQRIYYK